MTADGQDGDQRVKPVQWTDTLAVGMSLIDNEHKCLFEILNRLGALTRDGGRSPEDHERAVRAVIEELFSYSHYHFGHEEELMLTYKYERYQIHKKQHDNFISMISAIEGKRQAGENQLPELAQYVKTWILGHIAITDKALGEFLRMRITTDDMDFGSSSTCWAC